MRRSTLLALGLAMFIGGAWTIFRHIFPSDISSAIFSSINNTSVTVAMGYILAIIGAQYWGQDTNLF